MAIDWDKIKQALPKTTASFLADIQRAYESNSEGGAREVEKALIEKISVLQMRFEALKKEGAK